jgi:prepilin peptidase CpaA
MNFILASALAGGVLALIYLGLRAVTPVRPNGVRPQRFLARLIRAERRRVRRGGPLPYASAIALGAICVLFPSLVNV